MKLEITLESTTDLHASVAAKLVDLANRYDAEVALHYNNTIVDAKSILGLMSLAIPKGKNVRITATGPDAEQALQDLKQILL